MYTYYIDTRCERPVLKNNTKARASKSLPQGARLSPDIRKQQILEAAISYFAEVGFAGQTRELSRRIGVSQPLLYRYFPSKNDLINEVFDAVFMKKWDPLWIHDLKDRSVPLRDRLTRFYSQYAHSTYRPEWIRIYMFAGLAGMGLNRNYLDFVRKQLLVVVAEELRHALLTRHARTKAPKISAREIEMVWNLHGSMFYWAVRRNIFGIKAPAPFELRTGDAVDLFLAGAKEIYPRLLAGSGS
ncbi:MAG: TetR/AcrR family transcriptional regulator [Burkholderiaceae bacterium]